MKKILLGLGLVLLLNLVAPAQITTSSGSRSDAINIKLRKIDLLIKLLPLIIRKSQYPDLLTAVEKARERERQDLKAEDAALAALDPEISTTLDDAINKGAYPPHPFQDKIAAQVKSMDIKRIIVGAQMVQDIYKDIDTEFDAGQKKAMAGSFSDSYIMQGAKPGSIKDQQKIEFFVRDVFLDPLCYNLLLELQKHAS